MRQKSSAAARAREMATVSQFSAHHIHSADVKKYLAPAQPEFPRKLAGGISLEVPLSNGTVEVFELFEPSILAPAVVKKPAHSERPLSPAREPRS